MSKRDTSLKPGNMVRLRSGGPCMTVEKVDAVDDRAHCVWSLRTCEVRRDSFPLAVLVRWTRSDGDSP